MAELERTGPESIQLEQVNTLTQKQIKHSCPALHQGDQLDLLSGEMVFIEK